MFLGWHYRINSKVRCADLGFHGEIVDLLMQLLLENLRVRIRKKEQAITPQWWPFQLWDPYEDKTLATAITGLSPNQAVLKITCCKRELVNRQWKSEDKNKYVFKYRHRYIYCLVSLCFIMYNIVQNFDQPFSCCCCKMYVFSFLCVSFVKPSLWFLSFVTFILIWL